ncbi:relaxase/mobilization nuclease domain-containing protein [Sphingomonas sp. CARO-RG-8B-R24-01]|uniref:relaxase/mobilization nuclease domain-containing protein n=1 Tax=Sphingomonas sp. CARO-RG-8B-R24-01 TaxID=2914831 RepID=UPI001F56ACEE|nr:relaxase/mobilization nuclease domain-containing protein [Sphingomonas sp. CARO-RG-8B-R24-01]
MSSYEELRAAWYVWRPTHPKTRKGGGGDKGFAAALLSLPFRPSTKQTAEQFARLERRAPQVMVKVTKPTFGAAHTYQNMTYISRNCEEEILDQDGVLYTDNAQLEELADEWHEQNQDAFDGERRYRGPDARRLQFSMPPGTDAIALRNAVSATARHVFGDRYDYVYALHTDRPHPHVHLTVRAVSHHGESLRINKDDLLYLRRTMALELRMRGIDADATPQIARGPRVKHDRTEVHRQKEKRRAQAKMTGALPTKTQSGTIDPYTVRVYAAAAGRLRASGNPEDAALAQRIEAFAASRFAQQHNPDGGVIKQSKVDKPASLESREDPAKPDNIKPKM